jgi:peptide-methionine (S)-S-oxide reductase
VFLRRPTPEMVSPEEALPGRDTPIELPAAHHVLGTPMAPPYPVGSEVAVLGMGCFWGAERIFWQLVGVHTTYVGYAGGFTPNPTYEEVCSGRTGHAEVAVVVFDPEQLAFEDVLAPFWENHDPTTPNRQGNDVGTQYRSTILTTDDDQRAVAAASLERYQERLSDGGFGTISTTIEPVGAIFAAEPYHQQYLAKNPGGYCNHGFCQVAY